MGAGDDGGRRRQERCVGEESIQKRAIDMLLARVIEGKGRRVVGEGNSKLSIYHAMAGVAG